MDQKPQPTYPVTTSHRDQSERRRAEPAPAPPLDRIRELLGWWLIPENRL